MPESQTREWKRSWRDEHLKWICGFANARGGVLEIGKNDRGKVVGLEDPLRLLEDIPNKVQSLLGIVAEVNLRSKSGKVYLEIVVEPHPNPISYRGEFHYRSGSTKQVLRGAALSRFLLRRYGRTWDDVPLPGVAIGELDARRLEDYRRLGAESQRLPGGILQDTDDAVIDKLQLREAELLKRAAILLFHPAPQRFVMNAYVKIGYFRGSELVFQDVVDGDLFSQVDRTMDLLYTKYTRALVSYNDIYRVETFPVPREAMREALINAVIHRDYGSPATIQIRVYDDRIAIWNAVDLPSEWGESQLARKLSSKPHNPLIAYAFFRAGLIEAWGRGIERILDLCEEAGNPQPVWELEPGSDGLWLRFPFSAEYRAADTAHRAATSETRPGGETAPITAPTGPIATPTTPVTTPTTPATTPTTPATTPTTTPTSARENILALLKAEPRLTQRELAERVGLTRNGVKYHIKVLKAAGLIRRTGSSTSGRWVVRP